jgi:NADPH-dependent glutamate synthase beta subunit-like oxidoreductase
MKPATKPAFKFQRGATFSAAININNSCLPPFCITLNKVEQKEDPLTMIRLALQRVVVRPEAWCGRNTLTVVRSLSDQISVAIVGAGPSGCFVAKYLQTSCEKKGMSARIDVLDRLPTPYGLVRYGVAPDHPEVKNVQNDFDKLFNEKRARFLGNVHVGEDISVKELRELYDVVVLSYGCQSDRKLGIPGEDLEGVLSARKFVAWYNGRWTRPDRKLVAFDNVHHH